MASGLQVLLTCRFWELAPCLPNTFQRPPDGQTRADRGLEHTTPASVPRLPHEGHEQLSFSFFLSAWETKWKQLWAYPNHSRG